MPRPTDLTRRALLALMGAAGLPRTALGDPPPPAELLRLAGSCVLLGWRHNVLPDAVRRMLADDALGGVILARENFRSPRELTALNTELRRLTPAGVPAALIAADQEGGPVSHLSPAGPWTPSLTTLGAIDDLALTTRVAAALV